MTKPDQPLSTSAKDMLEKARPDQMQRLLADIQASIGLSTPTHLVSERPQ